MEIVKIEEPVDVEESVCVEDLDYYLHKVDHCYTECRVQQISFGRISSYGGLCLPMCRSCKFAMKPKDCSTLWCIGDSWTFSKVR